MPSTHRLNLSPSFEITTSSAVLTSQFQVGLYDIPSVDFDEALRSQQHTRRTKDRSWLGRVRNRLTDEQWGTAGIREREDSDGSSIDKTREHSEVLEMQTMVSRTHRN